MDKKNLIILLIILTGGLVISQVVKPPAQKEPPQKSAVTEGNTGFNNDSSQAKKETVNIPQSFAAVIKKIEPAVVNISAVQIVEIQSPFYRFYHGDPFEEFFNDFFGRSPRRETPEPETNRRRQEGTASGFIVSSEGYVLTNYHVIRDAEELKVTTYDGKNYDAELVGQDSRTDLAVICIKSGKKFDTIKFGNSDDIQIGDWVLAAGSPFGLNQTFTAGIISALRQDVQVEQSRYRNMLQTDAAINRGNSGGPLVNLSGDVVGINTAIFAPTGVFSGVGFAIPVNDAKDILEELIEKGQVIRGWLGVQIQDVNKAIQNRFNLSSANGVLVNRVVSGSPAEKGGLKRGDTIIEYNGRQIKDVRDLQQKVSSAKPKDKINLGVVREAKKTQINITLSKMPEEVASPPGGSAEDIEKEETGGKTAEWLGITVSGITGNIKNRYGLNRDEGVVVINVDPAAEGYEIGLRVGDVIVELNKIETASTEDFKKASKNVSLKDGVVFDIIRNERPLFISYQKDR